jgi:mono/diheme cytochrome c family protein
MAATDQFYRSQRTLDIVFAVSCVLMLVSVVWMFAADYNREFKHVQREFRDVDDALTERAMLTKMPNSEAVEAAQNGVNQAQAQLQAVKDSLGRQMAPLQTAKAKQEAAAQGVKADYDSLMSLYNIAVEERDEGGPNARNRTALERAVEGRRQQVAAKEKELAEAQGLLDKTNKEIETLKNSELEVSTPDGTKKVTQRQAEKQLSDAEDQLKKTAGELNRMAKAVAQKRWKIGDTIRNLPIIDGFAAPTKIQQYTLSEYPIDYSFKYVTRYDRCTTCHLGFDRPTFTKDALRQLADAPEGLQANLNAAHGLLDEQVKAWKQLGLSPRDKLGFDVSDVPDHVRTVKLDDSQINEYCVHPRLDLFVDANSPHPAEKFGCTSCHSGQGSATEFVLASHAPNSAAQKKEWTEKLGWESNHYWDYPMLPKRFVESSCLKCHHQVTDLIRYGNKLEAPKLIQGYNLVRESGCFGCHEISGLKNGQEIGPDLRLEPSPPLVAYTAGELARMLADPENPPGRMQKVGPSLYRLSEKTNQQWVRDWIQAPRVFRPTTKMPHFYGLSNNRPEVLPDDQKKFPDAEIHSITHYLFTESQDYLKGDDKYRKARDARIAELQQKKDTKLASDSEIKQFDELTRLRELDRPPVPLAKEIRDADGKVVDLPPEPADQKAKDQQVVLGRRLFSERGCLACHSHEGTTKASPEVPAVEGEATFGPDLSRVAAKIAPENGDAQAKRRWLVQWILNPKVHFPRTRMPYTHLKPDEAAAVAAWLLSQPPEGWDMQQDVPAPEHQTLVDLARVYLVKAPGMTRGDADEILASADGGTVKGITSVSDLPLDSDERALAGPVDDNKLKWYIGRKAITRLGCFGCHDVPGFATAKPIGTPLNDWGKKDPERLAFEDIVAYAKEHYRPVESMTDEKGHGVQAEGGKQPYEEYFLEALEHHTRDGFLSQKLNEPRSYDFNRVRSWDDRLRMPQFKFARSNLKPHEGESEEQARTREEAEAREAVMTFIFGLVAEPTPASYLYEPTPDRKAEIRGRQVIDKYNCAGCHQIRPGVYELARTPEMIGKLQAVYDQVTRPTDPAYASDYRTRDFLEHNAWTGLTSPSPDRWLMFGIPSPPPGEPEPGQQFVRLTQALRFQNETRQNLDIPAASTVDYTAKDTVAPPSEPLGGVFGNLMIHAGYLSKKDAQKFARLPNGESPDARGALPPPLIREGERTQPAWLFQFLRNPFLIRPLTILRMPRFNMSDDEAMDLVNYFAAVDKMTNPGIGLTYPYPGLITQRQEGFWDDQAAAYVSKLKKDKLEEKRINEERPFWDLLQQEELAQAEAAVKSAKDAEAKETNAERKQALADTRKAAEKNVERLKNGAAVQKELQSRWASKEAYAADAYRLLASNDRCLNCHQVGPLPPKQPTGPQLELSADRLRPEWLLRWIASPQRMLIYPYGQHSMPQNFKSNDTAWPEFDGTMLEQATAVRDVLVDYPKVSNMPVNRIYRPSGGK